MAEQCPHDNFSVTQVWRNGECVESHVRCDDCGAALS